MSLISPAAGLDRDRRQALTKGLRDGEHFKHIRGDPPGARHAKPQRSREEATGTVPVLVLSCPDADLRGLLHGSYLRLLLLLLHPMGPVHLDLDRLGQLP